MQAYRLSKCKVRSAVLHLRLPRIQRAPSRHCLEFTLTRKTTCHEIKCYPLLNRIKKIYSPVVHLARPIQSLFIESHYKHLKKPKIMKWIKCTRETGQGIQKKVNFYFLARFYPLQLLIISNSLKCNRTTHTVLQVVTSHSIHLQHFSYKSIKWYLIDFVKLEFGTPVNLVRDILYTGNY